METIYFRCTINNLIKKIVALMMSDYLWVHGRCRRAYVRVNSLKYHPPTQLTKIMLSLVSVWTAEIKKLLLHMDNLYLVLKKRIQCLHQEGLKGNSAQKSFKSNQIKSNQIKNLNSKAITTFELMATTWHLICYTLLLSHFSFTWQLIYYLFMCQVPLCSVSW